jgi:hypothetical protein
VEPNFVKNLCQKDSKSSHGVSIALVLNVVQEKNWVSLHGARVVVCCSHHFLIPFLASFQFGQLPLKKTKAKMKWRGEGEVNYLNYSFFSH